MSRKVRIKTAIYGKKVFHNKTELSYYKHYKKLNLDRKIITELHNAVGICDGHIRSDTVQEELKAWQFLIDTGMCWQLEGWFSRQANNLLQAGVCKEKILN